MKLKSIEDYTAFWGGTIQCYREHGVLPLMLLLCCAIVLTAVMFVIVPIDFVLWSLLGEEEQ